MNPFCVLLTYTKIAFSVFCHLLIYLKAHILTFPQINLYSNCCIIVTFKDPISDSIKF